MSDEIRPRLLRAMLGQSDKPMIDALLPIVNALIGTAYEDAINAVARAFDRREPSVNKWLPQFEVARDAIRQGTPADAARKLRELLAEARCAERERCARWLEKEDIANDPDDLYTGRKARAAALRTLPKEEV